MVIKNNKDVLYDIFMMLLGICGAIFMKSSCPFVLIVISILFTFFNIILKKLDLHLPNCNRVLSFLFFIISMIIGGILYELFSAAKEQFVPFVLCCVQYYG